MSDRDILQRDQLYEWVWSESAVTIAAKLGISSVGLAKICRKLSVPVPGRGYWARVRAGQKPYRAKLPALRRGQVSEHRITQRVEHGIAGVDGAAAPAQPVPTQRIVVPDTLEKPHKLVKTSVATLRKASKKGVRAAKDEACLDIHVSADLLDRAMRIMDTLLKEFEGRGYTVEVTEPTRRHEPYGRFVIETSKTQVRIEGIAMGFALEEERDCLKKEPPKNTGNGHYYSGRPEYDHVPNGKLFLRLERSWGCDGHRLKWKDGKHRRVEDCIDAFIATAIECARIIKAKEEERERQHELWHQQERERQEEATREQDLKQRLELFDEARRVEAFVTYVRQKYPEGEAQVVPAGVAEWLRWGDREVRWLLGRAVKGLGES